MVSASANGRGRTLYEILMGHNQKDSRPLELQFHNPLGSRVGSTISFEHEPALADINFIVEAISVYQTKIAAASFYHTDYHLKGISREQAAPVRFRLRLIADENVENPLGHRVQLLRLIADKDYDQDLQEKVLASPDGTIDSAVDENGYRFFNESATDFVEGSSKYWRVEDVLDPYVARVTILRDTDGNGTIEDDELEKQTVMYWDYSRLTPDPLTGADTTEFLTAEMDRGELNKATGEMDGTGHFKFFCGTEVLPSQIAVF